MNDAKYKYLQSLGYTGTLQDMEYAYYMDAAEGTGNAPVTADKVDEMIDAKVKPATGDVAGVVKVASVSDFKGTTVEEVVVELNAMLYKFVQAGMVQ